MRPGDEFMVVRGKYEGGRARLNKTDGFFCHIQLLTVSGRKRVGGLVSVHRNALAPLEDQRA